MRPPRLLYEDQIRSVEGPGAGTGGPEGTAPDSLTASEEGKQE